MYVENGEIAHLQQLLSLDLIGQGWKMNALS